MNREIRIEGTETMVRKNLLKAADHTSGHESCLC